MWELWHWVASVRFRFVCVAFWGQFRVFIVCPYDASVCSGHGWCLSTLWRQCCCGLLEDERWSNARRRGGMHCYLGCCSLIWIVSQSAGVFWDPSWLLQDMPNVTEAHLMCFLNQLLIKFSENSYELEHACVSRNIWNKTPVYLEAQAQRLILLGKIRLSLGVSSMRLLEQHHFSHHMSLT